jgi:hypothetical protein
MSGDLNDRFSQFDPAYVQNVVAPYLRVRIYQGERLSLPLIDPSLSKQNAMPDDFWGLMSETWKPRVEVASSCFCRACSSVDRTIDANASTCRQ